MYIRRDKYGIPFCEAGMFSESRTGTPHRSNVRYMDVVATKQAEAYEQAQRVPVELEVCLGLIVFIIGMIVGYVIGTW